VAARWTPLTPTAVLAASGAMKKFEEKELYQNTKNTVPNGQITVPKQQKPRFQASFLRVLYLKSGF